jgi:hypothetical protein
VPRESNPAERRVVCDYCGLPAAFVTKEERACERHASSALKFAAATAIAMADKGRE